MRRLLLLLLLLVAPLHASSKVGSFNVGTGAATTTVSVTGVGFQPKAIIFWWNGRGNTTDASGLSSSDVGFGFATSSTDRRAVGSFTGNAQAVSNTFSWHDADAIVIENGQTATGRADLVSMDADGFTIIHDFQFANDFRVGYWALGGTAITNVKTGSFQYDGTATPHVQAITGVGFQGDLLLLMAIGSTGGAGGVGFDGARVMFGAATSTANEHVIMVGSGDAQDPSATASYCRAGEILAFGDLPGFTTIGQRAEFSAWGSDGFSLNFLEGTNARYIHYMVIKGGSWQIGNFLTTTGTGTGNISVSVPGTTTGAMLLSAGKAESASDTIDPNLEISIGGFNSTSSRVVHGVLEEDNLATTEVDSAIEFDEIYVNMSTADAEEGLADIESITTTAFTLSMEDGDPAQEFVWYIAEYTPVAPGNPHWYYRLMSLNQILWNFLCTRFLSF